MNKNNFLKTISHIERETRKDCEDVLFEYLISIGGSLDVEFKMLSVSEDTYTDESIPAYVEISKVFIDKSSITKDVCVTSAPDGENWLLSEYLTLDETISLMNYIAEHMKENQDDSDGIRYSNMILKILRRNLRKGLATVINGPSNKRKTDVVVDFCKKTETPWTIIQMSKITDPTEQLIGQQRTRVADDGHDETYFEWAEFAKAIQKPGIVVLDDFNQIPKNCENVLFWCLTGTRELLTAGAGSNEQKTIKVHPECMMILNIADPHNLDMALINKLCTIEI